MSGQPLTREQFREAEVIRILERGGSSIPSASTTPTSGIFGPATSGGRSRVGSISSVASTRLDDIMSEFSEDEWVEQARAVAADTGHSLFDLLSYMSAAVGALAGFNPLTTTATITAIRQVWGPIGRILSRIPGSRVAARYLQQGNQFINRLGGMGTILSGVYLAGQFINILSPIASYLLSSSDINTEEQKTVQEGVTKINSIISKERQVGGGNAGQQQIESAYIAAADGSIKRAQQYSNYKVRGNRGTAATRPLISNERVMYAGY